MSKRSHRGRNNMQPLLNRLLHGQVVAQDQSMGNVISRCELFLKNGQYENACSTLRLQMEMADHPNLTESYFMVLQFLHANGCFVLQKQAAAWLVNFKPELGLAWNYLGIALIELGELSEALPVMRQAAALCPDNPHVLSNYANILISSDQPDKALEIALNALEINPTIPALINNAANAYRYCGNNEKALEYYLLALKHGGENAQILSNIGASLFEFERYKQAIEYYERALTLTTDFPLIYANLAWALAQSGEHEKARTYCEQALQKFPESQDVWYAYGYSLQVTNRINAAIDAFIKALALPSTRQVSMGQKIYSNLLFCLNYHADIGAQDIYGAYQDYDRAHGIPWKKMWAPHLNEKKPDKKLILGVVAHSFHRHPCARFMLPVYENLNREKFHLISFSTVGKSDEITEKFISLSDQWIDCRGINDDRLSELIRTLHVDILIDIDGHTAGNRLAVFARKPAPVTLHWLDFGYTTGLSAIDYYLSDQITAPTSAQSIFSEKIWHLSGPSFVYQPSENMPEPDEPPFLRNGYITFGCFSRAIRINRHVVKIWSAVLNAVENSVLVINSGDFLDHRICNEMAERFAEFGIDKARLKIGYDSPPWQIMQSVDIGLDCFPHNSGTTLCEMIYMGIPFITLADRPPVGRIGASILSWLGLEHLIAKNEVEYAEKLVILAHHLDELISLRKQLRALMQNSRLMNEAAFCRSMEQAFREMWQLYCAKEET